MTDAVTTATDEFVRRYADRYEAPKTSQSVKREYGRLRPWYETLALKGAIREEHAMAARDLDMYWHVVNDATGVCGAYGDQRWNGTPVGQLSSVRLLGPEWRETCRNRLAEAKATMDARTWDALSQMIEGDLSLRDLGQRLGAVSARQAERRAGTTVRNGLHGLATVWGYLRGFRDP